MKQNFESVLQEMNRWNKQGWHKEQTAIGCALYELFAENFKDISELWECCETPETFHKSFRQVPVLDYKDNTQRAIWYLIGISGHFWNAVLKNDPEFGEDVLDPFKE